MKDPKDMRQFVVDNAKDFEFMGYVPGNAFQDGAFKVLVTTSVKNKGGTVTNTTHELDIAVTGDTNSTAENMLADIFGVDTKEGAQIMTDYRNHKAYKNIIPTIGNREEELGAYGSSKEIKAILTNSKGVGSELLKEGISADIYRDPETDMFRFKWKPEKGKEQTLTYGELLTDLPLGGTDEQIATWISAHPNAIATLTNEIMKEDRWSSIGDNPEKQRAYIFSEYKRMKSERRNDPVEFRNYMNIMNVLQ